jgi:hypothetical protein
MQRGLTKRMEPSPGLEPGTCRLRIGCSTTELTRRDFDFNIGVKKLSNDVRETCKS